MILVVDDNADLVRLLRTALELEGFRVETASDGVQAYSFLREPDCECLVLDMNMPRLNGAELMLLMQADGVRVPTIVMAGFTDFNEDELRQFENVVKFLPKPFDLDVLVNQIRRVTGKETAEAV